MLRTSGLVAAAVSVIAVSTAGAAGAATTRAAAAPSGIVDVYTNLGYQDAQAAGTGIVLTSSGVVLTNNHVIRGATTVKAVDLDNGRTYKATVLGYTVHGDVAAIQLQNASGLATAPLGHSSNLRVGESVTTYGNAGGAGGAPSAAAGKIVGVGRSITARDDSGNSETLTGLIETNATLQPGDSGGPMVDATGHVIGMDTAASSSFTFESQVSRGFAVPIDRATSIVSQIVDGRSSATIHIGKTAFLGLSVQSSDPFFGQGEPGASGLVITEIVPGSPAARIGLNPSDVLTKFDGKTITTPGSLTALMVTKSPGQTVQIHWVDAYGTAHTSTITLASGPPQ
ncbi:MAG TPA: trypsin-like peptidase domain-containing protein [Gaiellaceae bacterium]|nr:trypsin-like peptidase domain-containing protein [Gaiellaceae bacterium]